MAEFVVASAQPESAVAEPALVPIPDPNFSPGIAQTDYGQPGGAQAAVACPGCSPVPVSPNVPILHSKPGSAKRLMLDFDGHCFPYDFNGTCPGQTVPFSLDSTKTTNFTAAELTAIRKIWECVAEDYSPFEVDVTTEEPAVWSEATDVRVVFDDHAGTKSSDWWWNNNTGYAYSIGAFLDAAEWNIAYVWYENCLAGDPEAVKVAGDTASHEAGHLYDLDHYTVGTPTTASIMWDGAISTTPPRERFIWFGDTSVGDLSKLKVAPGYRADDHGDTLAAATPLAAGVGFATQGIIGRNSGGAVADVDLFRLDVPTTGMVSAVVSVLPWIKLAGTGWSKDTYYANLDSKLTLLNSAGAQATDTSGVLVPGSSPTSEDLLGYGARIAARLNAGTYYLKVEDAGAYGSGLGTYKLSGSRPDPAAASNAPRVAMVQIRNSAGMHGTYPLPAGSGLQLRTIPIGGANQIEVAFSEHVSVQQDDLVLKRGAGSGATIAFTGFSYNASTWTATWTFAAVGTDQVLFTLKGTGGTAVVDAGSNAMDGEWTNPSGMYQGTPATSVFPSGNGSAGGDLVLRLTFLAGDTNCDGDVDDLDYQTLNNNFGAGTTWAQGDFDGDGDIDLTDFGMLQANYNAVNYRTWP